MAKDLNNTFKNTNDSIYWDSASNYVQCYCHKLALVVKHGLKTIKISVGNIKPTTQPGATVLVPTIVLNTCEDDINERSLSDEDDAGLTPTNGGPDCED